MFWIILIVGIVLFFVMRGKKDRAEQLGASRRALPTGPLEVYTFPCPHPKCPACGATGDKMKQDWDGLRAVKWTCGYCGALAGVQTLKDEELPPPRAGAWEWTRRCRARSPCSRAATASPVAAWAVCSRA